MDPAPFTTRTTSSTTFTQGLGLVLNRSVSVSAKASLSASFFGIGSSFELGVTASACQQLSTTAQETLQSSLKCSTDLQEGQAATQIALYFQDVLTANATAVGISVPFEEKFAITADPYRFPGLLSDADIRVKVSDILAEIMGSPPQSHGPNQQMNVRFGRKAVSAPLSAASVASLREGLRLKALPAQRLASLGASSIKAKARIISHH